MIKRGLIVNFLIGGLFYISIISMFINVYGTLNVKANELTEELENGLIPLNEETESDHSEILSDTVNYVQGVNDEMEDFENFEEDNTDNSSDNISEEDMTSDDKFRIMVIFCFGLCAGIIVGHFLTGFIK